MVAAAARRVAAQPLALAAQVDEDRRTGIARGRLQHRDVGVVVAQGRGPELPPRPLQRDQGAPRAAPVDPPLHQPAAARIGAHVEEGAPSHRRVEQEEPAGANQRTEAVGSNHVLDDPAAPNGRDRVDQRVAVEARRADLAGTADGRDALHRPRRRGIRDVPGEDPLGPAEHRPVDEPAVGDGQGIGAGIVLNGQLFSGDDYGAGEIGHVVVVEDGPLCKCGNHGCLEAVASIAWIVRRAQEIAEVVTTAPLSQFVAEGRTIDLEAVIQAFGAGDPAVRRLIEEVGRYLGIAVANLVGVLNVRRVVITGRVAPFGQALSESIQHELRRRVLPALAEATEVEVLAQGPDAVLLGTSALLLTNELGLTRLVRRDARPEEIAA